MGDLRRDTTGNWRCDEYIDRYLVRYRHFLNLSPLPSPQEKTPLISTLNGCGGLSDRHVRSILKVVFDRSLQHMQSEGWSEDEIDQLGSASLHWLRHTAATFDAPFREMKGLQADLRHHSLSTTQNTYYNALDEQRTKSVKGLKMRK
jgi:integrase